MYKRQDLHIGDMVYVEKGGEIIPKITGVDKDARSSVSYTHLFLHETERRRHGTQGNSHAR